jgi:hypothetical protein
MCMACQRRGFSTHGTCGTVAVTGWDVEVRTSICLSLPLSLSPRVNIVIGYNNKFHTIIERRTRWENIAEDVEAAGITLFLSGN